MNIQGSTSSWLSTDNARKYSPNGLLLRYARGRVRHFVHRQLYAFTGAVFLWAIISPAVGMLAFALTVLGDALDCFYLRRLPQLLDQGWSTRRLQIVSATTAGIGATAIAFTVNMPVYFHPDHAETLFLVGVLISAAINAGLVVPFNPAAGITRLLIFAAAPLVAISLEAMSADELDTMFAMHFAGLGMLYATIWWFVKFVTSTFERTRDYLLEHDEQRQQLEVSNALLQEQQEQARRLALVAEHANDSVFLIDRNGRIAWVNESFTRITGYSFSEAIGRTPCELLGTDSADPKTIEVMMESRERNIPFRLEIRSRRKDGTPIWIETNQVPVRGYKGEIDVTVAVERDVTAAHLHAQQLEDARVSAEEGERTKADFLATMSHEIRTPMNGVIGMAQMLEGTSLDLDQRVYTDTILSSSKTLLSLINDVLDLSKLDANMMSFSRVDFDIRTCFEETLRLLETQAHEKGLTLVLDVPKEVPRRVHGDDSRIRQILLNLVGNAIKFTENGEVRVALDVHPQGDTLELCFSVTDTGIGIPEDKIERVFGHFSQADAATTRKFGGTGLGLTISRKLARAMGGEIAIQSEVGVGTCLTVSLQLAIGSALPEPEKDEVENDYELPSVRPGMRVLVAEDNKVNRLVMQKFLRDTPIELEFAHNGVEAVEKVQLMKPDLVFMDMSMPVMSGIDATLAIRNSDGVQPVIVALTANAFDSDRDACLQAGMDEFLSKPLNRKDVLAVLQRHGADA